MNLKELKKLRKRETVLREQLSSIEKREVREVSKIKSELNILNKELRETQDKISVLERIIKERKEKSFLFRFWKFLNEDTWQSWLVSLILIVIVIKFIFFPTLSFLTQTPLPIVVVESCSMYHESSFDDWWEKNRGWYEDQGITKAGFEEFSFKNGLNKGDIIFVWGRGDYDLGDIIIFNTKEHNRPIIHRIISQNPIETKGDHNPSQASFEKNIAQENILGKSVVRIPLVGWVKLIFFEPFQPESNRGFCS
jgi:signal peptidase I